MTRAPGIGVLPVFEKGDEVFFSVTVIAHNVSKNASTWASVRVMGGVQFLGIGRGFNSLFFKNRRCWPGVRDSFWEIGASGVVFGSGFEVELTFEGVEHLLLGAASKTVEKNFFSLFVVVQIERSV